MKGFFSDCRHALRLYSRTPGTSLIVVAMLAVGMACVTACMSLYVDLTVRPYPGFENSRQIVTYGWSPFATLNADLIQRIAAESVTLDAAAGTTSREFQAGPDGDVAVGEIVTAGYFDGLSPRLAFGRGLNAADHLPDAEPVVVISWRYWQRMFGGRDDVLGTMLAIRDDSPAGGIDWPEFRIVGVASPEFPGIVPLSQDAGTDIWLSFERWLALPVGSELGELFRTTLTHLRGVGRRARGAGNAAIARELGALGDRYVGEIPELPESVDRSSLRFMVFDGIVVDANVQRDVRRQLRILLAASVLLAVVAAANVSLFLVARAPGRQRELGVRMAVGAPLRRLARQLASEACVLVVIAAVIGLGLSIWLAGFLRGLEILRQARWMNVSLLDWHVLAAVGVLLASLTLVVSLAPILRLKRLGIQGSSRQVSARASTAQWIAGNVQMVIAGTLSGAAVAFALHLGSLIFGHPGYETRDLHVAQVTLDGEIYYVPSETGNASARFVDQLRRRETIAALPGVTGVSLTSAVPGMRRGVHSGYLPDPDNPDDPAAMAPVSMIGIDDSYVDLLGLTLLHGRVPEPNEPTAILVNRSLARMMWGREDVVGEYLPLVSFPGSGGEVVGVLADLPYRHPSAEPDPLTFTTSFLQPRAYNVALIRSADSSATVRRLLQGLVDSGALELTVGDVTPLAALRRDSIAADRARGLMAITAAILVVLLSAFGFYGTQRYLVEAGRREMAIRASLGAGPTAISRLVIGRGLLLGLPGLVLGGLLAFIVAAWLRDDYVPRDIPPALVASLVIAGLVALLLAASLGPARSAKRTQPAILLREE